MRTIYRLLKGFLGYLNRSVGHLFKQQKKYAALGIPLGEVLRLRSSPYQLNTETILFAKKITINSPYWYLHGLKEIFFDESYLFTSKNNEPFIIDCGANIGVSV